MQRSEALHLLQQAAQAMQHAHAAYSGYPVGAALQGVDGTVWTGVNVENASYSLTVCAERTAVFRAVATGNRRFRALAVVCRDGDPPFPCGACRQVLAEFCDDSLPVLAAAQGALANYVETTLGRLLPHAFRAAGRLNLS